MIRIVTVVFGILYHNLQITKTMETIYTSVDHNELDADLGNIITMNTVEDYDDDVQDYDLDYDPNDFYYELQAMS